MNNILVTGGAGFLGSHLCERLLQDKNNYVYCLDNFYTGKEKTVHHLFKTERFDLLNHDVQIPLHALPKPINEIYNLACPASPIHYQYDPIMTTKVNVLGAINMLTIAQNHKAKILQASTSEIYGDPEVHPQHENYFGNVNTTGPRSCYDEGKRCAETLFADYQRQHNTQIRIARIFNTYGPNMQINDGRVISNFIVQALRGEDITVYGDGLQTRSFCYVDDLIDGLYKLMNLSANDVGPINLGNPNEFTILQLVTEILRLTNSKSGLIFKPLPIDDPIRRQPDISLAKMTLNWEPRVCLEDGLKETILYFKNELKK